MEKIIENTVYSCGFCGKTYDGKDTAEKHLEECVFNFMDNRTCYTCDHAIIVKEAPYGQQSGYKDRGTVNYLGYHDYIKCGKTGKKLEEEVLYDLNRECWDKFTDDKMTEERTKEYDEYLALVHQTIEEEEAFGELFLEEQGEKTN